MSAADDALLAQIAERRNDEAFMARLRTRMAEDAPLLDRLRDGECNQPLRLVESRDGGAVLLYECPVCLARVVRTREQAEADAHAKASGPTAAEVEVARDPSAHRHEQGASDV